ncbi:MAG: MFS transporter, partial [Oscillospiraceae bacterium]
MPSSKKMGLNKKAFAAICALAIAGSVIYELPYIKYVYYDSLNVAFGMTEEQSGFLLSMYAIGCIIFYIPGGIIADRYSTKKLMIISLLSTGVLGMILAFTMSYTAALIIFFLFAISTSFVFWTALMKALRIIGGKEDSGSAYGWYYALGSVVALVASFVFLYFYNLGLPDHKAAIFGVIMSMSIAAIISAVLVLFLYKDNDDPAAQTAEEDRFHFKDLPLALKNKYVWLASILMFLM